MGFFSNLFGGLFGGSNAGSNIFSAILGGIAGSGDHDDQMDLIREQAEEGGKQERRTLEFEDQLAYFRSQQRRHETSRALDSAYRQFSTVRDFAPNYVRGTGLDALPPYPVREPEDD